LPGDGQPKSSQSNIRLAINFYLQSVAGAHSNQGSARTEGWLIGADLNKPQFVLQGANGSRSHLVAFQNVPLDTILAVSVYPDVLSCTATHAFACKL